MSVRHIAYHHAGIRSAIDRPRLFMVCSVLSFPRIPEISFHPLIALVFCDLFRGDVGVVEPVGSRPRSNYVYTVPAIS